MALDAGQLDRQIQLLSKSTTRDAVGQPIDVWTPVATIYAQRLTLNSVDIALGAGKQTIPEGKYRIRYRNGVSADMRVLADDGQTYAITAVDMPDRRQTLLLTLQGAGNGG